MLPSVLGASRVVTRNVVLLSTVWWDSTFVSRELGLSTARWVILAGR